MRTWCYIFTVLHNDRGIMDNVKMGLEFVQSWELTKDNLETVIQIALYRT